MDIKVGQGATSPLTAQSTPVSSTESMIPRPQYFLSRLDGTLTPLIAVDELPSSIRIAGVSAVISQAATVNMMSLGVKDRSQTKYIVEVLDDSVYGASKRSNSIESIPNVLEKEILNQKPVVEKAEGCSTNVEGRRNDVESGDKTQATIDAVIAANDKPSVAPILKSQNTGNPGTFGKKVYCTHWIRWGECDYMQQGCLYKHEMPDEETLIAIGIRATPKWYRDINAPKNGWVGRPAPADQLWRGRPSTRAKRSEQEQTFHSVQSSGPLRSFEAPHPPTLASRPPMDVPRFESPLYPEVAALKPKLGYGAKYMEPRSRSASNGLPCSFPSNDHNITSTPVPSDSFPFTSPTFSSAANLPTSLAPTHRSIAPFLARPSTFQPPPPSFPEIKTPVPRYRRMFVPDGESDFVSNSISNMPREGKQKPPRRDKGGAGSERRGGIGAGSKKAKLGFGRGKVMEELLVDI